MNSAEKQSYSNIVEGEMAGKESCKSYETAQMNYVILGEQTET